MTDSQSNPAKSIHREKLESMFDPSIVDAFAGLAREQAVDVFNDMKDDIRQLVAEQLDVKRRAQELPTADQAAVAPQVNDASRQAREVAEDANDIDARQRADQPVDPQEIRDLDERAAQARESTARASEAVESRRQPAAPAVEQDDPRHGAIRRVVEEQEAQQAERSIRPAPAPAPSRAADRPVGGFVTQTQLKAELDQVNARINGVNDRVTRAIAIAQASATSVAPLRRAATWAMIAFVAVGVLYLLITGLTPIEHVWRDNFAWAFGVAFIAWCAGVMTANDASADAEARSEAHTGHGDDAGLDLVQDRRDHDDQPAQYPGHARSPRATADAHASVR
jgi:hypothetical protein